MHFCINKNKNNYIYILTRVHCVAWYKYASRGVHPHIEVQETSKMVEKISDSNYLTPKI